MILRPRVLKRIDETFRVHPVAALLGARQCGKTTIARMIAGQRPSVYFDFENPVDAHRQAASMRALEKPFYFPKDGCF